MSGKSSKSLTFLPYAKQSIGEEDIEAVGAALKGETITRGAQVEAFERTVAEYCGAQYAVAFNSGTSALMGAYFAARTTAADRVISTPNTFVATVGSAVHFGAYPQFVDIDRRTGNLNLERLKEAMNFQSTRGKLIIVPVHFAGIPVDMRGLDQLVHQPSTVVIEDAAQAFGSLYPDGQRVGCCAWSQMTVFSFHPAKIVTTGEGGMVTTNDPELYHRLQLYRNNGIERESPYLERESVAGAGYYPGYYEVQAVTGNFNFTDFQAALGLSQLQKMQSFIAKRRRLVKVYRDKLKGIPYVELLTDQWDRQVAFHLFVVQIDFQAYRTTKEEVMNQLKERGIGTQVHYIPVYRHPFFERKKGELKEEFPETEIYYERALSLPLYSDLEENDVKRICKELLAIL